VTAAVAHRVDGTGTAENLAARPVQAATAELLLRLGVERPVDVLQIDQLGEAGGHVNERMPVRAACFEQQNTVSGVFSQPVGEHTAGRAGPDDDVVKFHTLPY
jgi:hypothetical protein